ncbi:ethanolamine permease [Falsiroseomonas tokyonensis]|uniref:Ethanolamine permease n=1 Tax=Falsiroseomonas tokyonensis TaxID=430521 RepID=A0ABV7BYP0_9PROT|nr:ethanolamine permease [Falsiroseomonas tokyonensis]MBU8539976.1 ethanolamine permease [Falsiroseomonas tokyonensis]
MRDKVGPGGVTYAPVAAGYFESRGLRRHAGVASLWALGVGAVISGDFSGWNFGLGVGGFGGMLLATLVIMTMYLGLTFSLAEMSPALPHTGGAYSFARSTMGPWGGFFTGLAENVEFVLTPTVVVFFISTYMGAIFGTPGWAMPLWWLGFYAVFLALNIWGVELSFRVTLVVTLLALAVLALFWISALPHFRWELALNIPPEPGHSAFLPFGLGGVLAALPFAVWFFLAIEQLPLAAEESHDPQRDMPRGILAGMATLVVTAFLTLVLTAGIGGGAAQMGTSAEPILDGFRAIYGGDLARLLALAAVIGLVASFHAILFAFGRQIYSLSRAGYLPRLLSLTHPERKTPVAALLAGSALGLSIMLLVWLAVGEEGATTIIGTTLLNMAVFGAMLSYLMQAIAFIRLRLTRPDIPRPYRSPLGIPGAVATAAIALLTLAWQVQDPAYRAAVLPVAGWIAVGMAYFALRGRHRLVLSPEEAFAMRR